MKLHMELTKAGLLIRRPMHPATPNTIASTISSILEVRESIYSIEEATEIRQYLNDCKLDEYAAQLRNDQREELRHQLAALDQQQQAIKSKLAEME